MYRDALEFSRALELESEGLITICDVSGKYLDPIPRPDDLGKTWKDNFLSLQRKFRNVPLDKLLDFCYCKYVIEVKQPTSEPFTASWRYLHALDNPKLQKLTENDLEYIYVLVNDGYPDLVKIGITLRTIPARVKGLNSAGTVHEWTPKFGIAVKKGTAFKLEHQIHKRFAEIRVSSDKGSKREFFSIDCLTAFDVIREIGALHIVGNPIVF